MSKRKSNQSSQSARFIEAAKKAEADESGKKFERAFRKIVPSRARKTAKHGH
jgi:hypothetical protein